MKLERGDLVYVQIKGPYTGKPRPVVVVQQTETLALRDSVTVCPITGHLIDAPLFRVRIQPSAQNGLSKPADVMADKLVTVPKDALDPSKLGTLNATQMARLDRALAFWLGL